MPTSEFDPTKFFDREDEQRIFEELLEFKPNAPRIMAVRGGGGGGKSYLLKKLQHYCLLEEIPVCLIALDDLKDINLLPLVSDIAEQLNRAPDVNLPSLRAFRAAQAAREQGNAIVINNLQGTVDASNGLISEVKDSTFIGVQVNGPSVVTDQIMLDDIWAHFQSKRAVVLFDAFDKCNPELIEKIHAEFLNPFFFRTEKPRPNLLLIVAGRSLDIFEPGRRWKKERLDAVVRQLDKLSLWEKRHIEACCKAYGLSCDPTIVTWLHKEVTNGAAVSALVNVIQSMRSMQAAGGHS